MCATGKKFMLDLPLKVILTEKGSTHFMNRNKSLLRFKLADNKEEYGISIHNFSPISIQNMILVDYISKIEISMSEFVSKRQEIMDLSKLIVFTLLYKQFDREIFSKIIQCDCVRKYNRGHAAHLIDEKTQIPEKQLRLALSHADDSIQLAKKTILEPVWKSILDNKDYTPEEKNVYLLMTEKFLNRLGLMNWYILQKFYRSDGFTQMLSVVRQVLAEYMDKSKVAEYISLMVMELALNCENTNMRKEARRMYQGTGITETAIYEPDIRANIISELEKKKELVYLSWKLGGGSSSIGKQGRLEITLYNRDDDFQEAKVNVESKRDADISKRSLIDFYRQEGGEGTDLGLYYLSYLDDACKKVGIKFDSLVNQFQDSDLTVIQLNFNF